MYVLLGSALLLLTLYMSTLSYVLRAYSRSRLSDRLKEVTHDRWVGWLDDRQRELQVATSFARIVANLSLLMVAFAAEMGATDVPFEHTYQVVLPPLITVLLLMVFAIGIPNALAVHAGEAVLARSLRVLQVMMWFLRPISLTLLGIDFVVRRLLGKRDTPEEHTERIEQGILEAVSDGEARGAVDEEQKEMIESVIELHETTVDEIMTPRTEVVALAADASFENVRDVIVKAGHSRIPVYEDTIDHIIGVLYAKDLIGLDPKTPFDLRGILRTVPYVPETKTIDHLLREFRQNKVHIALVLDEYGGTAGLVTIEDIIEEVVGEIDDEYDRSAPPPINRVDDDTLEVDARVHVDEVNDELRIELPEDEDYETIGGFVFSALGKIPETGEEFTHDNVHFHVVAAEPRKINRLRIHVERPATKQSA